MKENEIENVGGPQLVKISQTSPDRTMIAAMVMQGICTAMYSMSQNEVIQQHQMWVKNYGEGVIAGVAIAKDSVNMADFLIKELNND